METDTQMIQILDSSGVDFKTTAMNMAKILRYVHFTMIKNK